MISPFISVSSNARKNSTLSIIPLPEKTKGMKNGDQKHERSWVYGTINTSMEEYNTIFIDQIEIHFEMFQTVSIQT